MSDADPMEPLTRLQNAFDEALTMPPEQRAEYLDRLALDPPERRQIERMLALAGTVDDPIRPALFALGACLRPDAIGPWRLISRLGSGGMGEVWLAERLLADTRQRVALKLFHAVGEEARRRIARERRSLAALAHPGLASLIDGGEDACGRPWLAMQYVEGQTLPTWVKTRCPDLNTRLLLVMRLCAAIEHAHQRLILHRDIKPSNVIVRPDGTPVLIDFGIATPADDASEATLSFTPAYAAPEQLAHQPATTATDVFGLGMVAYWLLTEASVASLRAGGRALPMASTVCRDPDRARRLRGELDQLLARATHPEPGARYPTATALAMDLDAYLDGRPISAMSGRWSYRVRKFVQRHAVVLAGLGLLLAGGVLFLVRLEQETRRARAAESQALLAARSASAAHYFLRQVLEATAPERSLGQPLLPERLLAEAADRVRTLDPAARVERATVQAVLVSLYGQLGEPAKALALADDLLSADAEALTPELVADLQYQRAQAALTLGRLEAVAPALDAAAAAHVLLDPDRRVLADAYLIELRGRLALARGDAAEAHRLLEAALAQWQGRDEVSPGERLGVAIGVLQAAQRLGGESAIESALARVDRLEDALPQRHPMRIQARRAVAQWALESGRTDAAIAALHAAHALARELFGEDSRAAATVRGDLAVALNRVGDAAAAITHLRWLGEWSARRLGPQSNDHLLAQVNLAAALEAHGDLEAAVATGQRVLAALEGRSLANPDWMGAVRATLARALALRGEHDRAVPLMRQAVADACRIEGPGCTVERFRLVGILRRAGLLQECESLLAEIGEPLAELAAGNAVLSMHVERLRALLALDAGRKSEARTRLLQLSEQLASATSLDGNLSLLVTLDLVPLLVDAGHAREAAARLRASLPRMQRAWAENSPMRASAEAWWQQLRSWVAPGQP